MPAAGVNPPVLKKFAKAGWTGKLILVLGVFAVVAGGVATGWLLSGANKNSTPTSDSTVIIQPKAGQAVSEAGVKEEKGDSATGTLEEGGISGEGTHHLVRDGGKSQYVYLTSTVIDLQSFIGKKVQVWGETISARKAGWLMDVSKVKVVE